MSLGFTLLCCLCNDIEAMHETLNATATKSACCQILLPAHHLVMPFPVNLRAWQNAAVSALQQMPFLVMLLEWLVSAFSLQPKLDG